MSFLRLVGILKLAGTPERELPLPLTLCPECLQVLSYQPLSKKTLQRPFVTIWCFGSGIRFESSGLRWLFSFCLEIKPSTCNVVAASIKLLRSHWATSVQPRYLCYLCFPHLLPTNNLNKNEAPILVLWWLPSKLRLRLLSPAYACWAWADLGKCMQA